MDVLFKLSGLFKLNAVLVIVAMCAAAALYESKREAQVIVDQLARLSTNIVNQKEKIHLLTAEWNLRSHPGNIASLVANHANSLHLTQVEPTSYSEISDIPIRSPGSKVGLDDDIGSFIDQIQNAGDE